MACIFKRAEFFDLTPIGLLCLLLLVGRKCKVIVAGTSKDAMRLDLVRELGADVTVNASER